MGSISLFTSRDNLQNQFTNFLSQQGWYSVSDLESLLVDGAQEEEMLWESLQPRTLPQRKSPVVKRVDAICGGWGRKVPGDRGRREVKSDATVAIWKPLAGPDVGRNQPIDIGIKSGFSLRYVAHHFDKTWLMPSCSVV